MMTALLEARTPEDYAAARTLLLEYAAALGVDLCFQGFSKELDRLAEMYGPPSGCLILARDGDELLGCVAIRPHQPPGTCEMKRLYVCERARRRGLGRSLAGAAVEVGRRLGYSTMVLDTLETMEAARRIYRELGFRESAAYYRNPLPGVRYMSRELQDVDVERRSPS